MHLLENSNKEKIKKKQKRRLKRKIQSQEHDKSILKGIANCRILGINVFGHVNYPVGATYIYIYIHVFFSYIWSNQILHLFGGTMVRGPNQMAKACARNFLSILYTLGATISLLYYYFIHKKSGPKNLRYWELLYQILDSLNHIYFLIRPLYFIDP